MKKFLLLFMVLFLSSVDCSAEMIAERSGGAIIVKSANISEVEELFKQHNYQNFAVRNGVFPRIYLTKLPRDWQTVPDNNSKHQTFIRIILPLVLKVNEDILHEREQISNLWDKFSSSGKLSSSELQMIEDKSVKYNISTPLSGDTRIAYLLKHLLNNVDVLPPSLMISTAAIYTDWGMSRLAVDANSLYRTEVWYTNQGLKPLDDSTAEYSYKIYANLEECIAERALQLNSHINYEYFRKARTMNREINQPPHGPQLAVYMIKDSNLPNIAGLIDYTFTFYKLDKTDYFPKLEGVK